jgi:UDP-glucose 4-epimerase
LRPISPYGATKVAAEHLCRIYQENFGLPICILRYFTVYGPRQRPDMAFSRWISALRVEQPIQIFGDGNQTRDFTFVADTVRANMLAAERGIPGEIYNIAGGSNVSPRQVIEALTEITGLTPKISWEDAKKGDPRHTLADVSKAKDRLGFTSQVSLREGLAAQVMDSLKRSRESVGGE